MPPLKRHLALQPWSRDHHEALMLGWKIRRGVERQVAVERIQEYAHWFYQQQLVPHFRLEEEHVFPLLGADHPLVQQALVQHQQLHQLFTATHSSYAHWMETQQLLEAHVRMEERQLFETIQTKCGEEGLSVLQGIHPDQAAACIWHGDAFWL